MSNQHPLLLHLETSTSVCSVAVSRGPEMLSLHETAEPYQHTTQLTILIQRGLEEAKCEMKDIEAVSLSRGPGSYTSLRVGASVAKGICYALDKRLIAIDTLQSLAVASQEESGEADALFCPMIDARRMEVYMAMFDSAGKFITEIHNEILEKHSFQAIFEKNDRIVFSGDGSEKLKNLIDSPLATFSPVRCSAKHLVFLAWKAFTNNDFADAAYFSPFYFKAPNITLPKKIL